MCSTNDYRGRMKLNKSYLFWCIQQVFNFNKSDQQKVDIDWFWKVEFPDWWMNTKIYTVYLNLKHRVKSQSEDDFPF